MGIDWMRIRVAKAITLLIFGMYAVTSALAEGEVKSLKDFQYWDKGTVRQCDVYDPQSGRLKAKVYCLYDGSVEKVEMYDGRGNKVEAALYDGKGRLKTGLDGWAAMRWWYEGPQLMWQVSYDEDGRVIERKLYSSSGKLAMRLYREDETVNPYVNAAMYMMLGARNVGYYDSRATFDEANRFMKE